MPRIELTKAEELLLREREELAGLRHERAAKLREEAAELDRRAARARESAAAELARAEEAFGAALAAVAEAHGHGEIPPTATLDLSASPVAIEWEEAAEEPDPLAEAAELLGGES